MTKFVDKLDDLKRPIQTDRGSTSVMLVQLVVSASDDDCKQVVLSSFMGVIGCPTPPWARPPRYKPTCSVAFSSLPAWLSRCKP
jgi:hypothetical protein